MDENDPATIIDFPVHRRGSLADTLSGFPERPDAPAWSGERRERRVTMLMAELRGWQGVADRIGALGADAMLDASVAAQVQAARNHGGTELVVGGEPRQPVLSAVFTGDGHAERALSAAVALRDAVDAVHSPHELAMRVSVGIDTGTVVDTVLSGNVPVTYRAVGTVRMFAVRLQEFAGPGQIFASSHTLAEVGSGVGTFRSIGEVRTNPGGETAEAFCLIEPREASAHAVGGR
jgi:class 3 adenylate cyclase